MAISIGCSDGFVRRALGVLLVLVAGPVSAQAVDYCNLQSPASFVASSGEMSPLVYGRIFEDDNGVLTSAPGAHPAVIGQLGYGPLGSDPRGGNPAWQWLASTYTGQFGNDDEYAAMFQVPFGPTSAQLSYTYRFSVDAGASFTYCDGDGNGENAGLSFDSAALGTMTILTGGEPSMVIDDVTQVEGNSGTTAFEFTVSIDGPSTVAVTFDIATADNTASTFDGDYVAKSITGVVIPAGQTSTTFTVQVNGDTVEEPNQTFFVNITNVSNAVVIRGVATGTIVNDDDPCAGYAFPYTLASTAPAELIQAITCANANGAGSDTIDLAGQTITLSDNHVTLFGSTNGLPQITSAIVIRNGTITRGGATLFRFFFNSSDLTLNDVTLSNGVSGSDGGAIYNAGTLTINRGRLLGNSGNFGGAIFNHTDMTANLNNTLIAGNRSTNQGGGIRNRGTLVLKNSTVASNYTSVAVEGGGGIANAGTYWLMLDNTIVHGNASPSVPANNEIFGVFTGSHNIVGIDPAFVAPLDASAAPGTGGDYRLGAFSIAIDAGDNSLVPPGVDLDGNARFFDDINVPDSGVAIAPVVDLGAYERQSVSAPPQADIAITKSDGQGSDLAGTDIVYSIVVSNAGPDAAPGTAVRDTFPAILSGVTWTCSGSAGGTCTASGIGDIDDVVDLPAGGSVSYTATATIAATASGVLSNTATASVDSAIQDPDTSNNSATDTTTVIALPQISVADFSAVEGDVGTTVFDITVALSSPAPAGGVTFDIATSDATASAGSDYVARSLTSQTIPAGSSTYVFAVTVNGDALIEADETLLVDIGNVGGALIADGQGVVTLLNDDVASVSVAPTTVSVAEGGASAAYTVVLTSQPTGTVDLSISGDAQTSVAPTALGFTAADWNVPQTVTVSAIDDAIAEGAHVGAVTHAATGGGYDAVAVAGVTVNIADNDSAGVQVVQAGGSTDVEEGGVADTFTVSLTTQPSVDVTIALTADDQVDASPATLVFGAADWNIAQTVTVTAIDDAVAEGDHGGTITFAVTSADASFNGLAVLPVAAAVGDNDTAAVVITQSGGSTAVGEAGSTDTYDIVLGSEPVGTVTIAATGDAQVLPAPATLTFTAANWNVPQTVTVSAVDDALAEGAHFGTISHTAAGGGYDGIVVGSVTVGVVDDDFTIGGTVTGLTAAGLILQNNGGDNLVVPADGGFTFGTALGDGSGYVVSVLAHPEGQDCIVANGEGTLSGADVTDVAVTCNTHLTLALSTTSLDLGDLAGGSSTAGFTITNAGSDVLVLSAIDAPAAPFALTAGSCLALPLTLPAGGQCTVTVGFSPAAPGTFSDRVEIVSNALGSPHRVSLRGSLLAGVVAIPATGPFALLLMMLALVAAGRRFARAGRRRE